MEQHTGEGASHFVSLEERRQLVRLCAAITGDREATEDLALVTRFESVTDSATLTVVPTCDIYEVLRIYRGGR